MEDLLIQGRLRSFGRWRSLVILLVDLTSLFLPQTVTAASIISDADVLSSNLYQLPKQSHLSSIPPSFVILILGKSATLCPRQNQHWPKPTIHKGKLESSALRFWTRAESDDEITDSLNKGVNVRFSDYGAADDKRDDDSLSYSTIQLNTTDKMDNNTKYRDITISIDNSTEQNKRSRWERLSSMPGVGALLPGKPLFMRLMPIKSSEIISQIMEEIPVQNDVQMGIVDGVVPLEREQTDLRGLDQEDKDSKTTSNNRDERQYSKGEEDPTASKIPRDILDEQTNKTVNDSHQTSNMTLPPSSATTPTEMATTIDVQDHKQSKRKRFFQRKPKRVKDDSINKSSVLTKEELKCPVIATNIHELQSAVLINKVPLRDVGFRFPIKGVGSEFVLTQGNDIIGSNGNNKTSFGNASISKEETRFIRDDPVLNSSLSSLLTSDSKSSSSYQRGIKLINYHPVLSIVRERVESNSKPGDRLQGATSPDHPLPHLALVIEGGGMRGAVSAGMAAALSTLDLLDAFDSIHGSSAGAIVGAYLVSRQLCTDVYTDIMPAAGRQFASKRRGAINFGVDWLGDLIQRKLLTTSFEKELEESPAVDGDIPEDMGANTTSGWCEDDDFSSVELAMGRLAEKQSSAPSSSRRVRHWSDDHHDGILFESANYLYDGIKSSVSKPLSLFGVRRLGRALRPALSAFDFASSMRQYLRSRPGLNLTYVLDGIMDTKHGLRPFDIDAFHANDKRQPLYIVASAVNNGGRGEMETIAFNSKDGDYFGSVLQENNASSKEMVSWYRQLWMMVKSVPYSIFSAARKALFTDAAKEFSQPVKDTLEAEMIPPGTQMMAGFANRHKIRKLRRPQVEKNYDPTGRINDEGKNGIFACLEASMLVPGAAGSPIQLIRSKNRKFIEQRTRFPRFRPRQELNRRKERNSHLCYDALCYEPIPYRSAVEVANATHVLALRSRPDGCVVETRQHMYERVVCPIYFRKYGMNQVAKLFSSGGSQYRYIEDVLTLNEGLTQGIAMGRNDTSYCSKGVKVPPTKLFYGNDIDSVVDMDNWKRAHLLPITLPFGTPELPTLSQDKDEVLKAVRNGYAAAFDILAPIASLPFDSSTIQGEKVAKLLFPDGDDIDILNKPMKIKPSYIGEGEEEIKRRSFAAWITRKREAKRKAKKEIALHPDGALARRVQRRTSLFHETDQYVRDDSNTLEYIETEALLAALPGFRGGRLDHIADNLLANEERKRKS